MKRLNLCVTLAAAAFAASGAAFGAYPERPVRVIVPYSPGGTSDFVGRLVAEGLTRALGQQLVVDNRGGAGSALGTKLVADSQPDGYTLIVNNIGLAVNETLRPDRDYVALKDLAPISIVGFTPSVLIVNVKLPFKNLKDWVAAAKAQPGKLSFGSAGAGSSTHLSMAYLQSVANIKLLHVPYKGGNPAMRAMIGGEVNCVMTPIPTAYGNIKAGAVRPLAVTSAKRSSVFPDLPTVAEAGIPGYEFSTWYGLLTRAGTPNAVITQVNQAVHKALKMPDIVEKLQTTGLDPDPGSPEEFRKFIQAEIDKWRNVIEEAGITKR